MEGEVDEEVEGVGEEKDEDWSLVEERKEDEDGGLK